MATLTVKNIPATLVTRLKRQAHRHHRSLNREVIACLERAIAAAPIDVDAELARIRTVRAPIRMRLDDATLRRLKSAGRQ
jgi:plasmid stability protein